jgi:hypothetical protein
VNQIIPELKKGPMDSHSCLLKVEGISKAFPGVQALDDLSMEAIVERSWPWLEKMAPEIDPD